MKFQNTTVADIAQQYQQLETTCRIWIAAAQAKDQRIDELTAECDRLRARLLRVSRRLGQLGPAARRHSASQR